MPSELWIEIELLEVGRDIPNFILLFTFSCNLLVDDPALDIVLLVKLRKLFIA